MVVILAIFVGVMFACWLTWRFKKVPSPYEPNPVRPENFPEVLIAPQEAESPNYVTPKTPGIYVLSYFVNEIYPGANTRRRISQHLVSHGFRRLAYNLLNPHFSSQERWTIDDKVRPDKTKSHWLSEEWINDQNEVVSAILVYRFPVGGGPDPNELYVDISFFEKDSWMRVPVAKYKELHPEEFRKDVEPEQ